MSDKMREEFESEMRANGMFDSGSYAMARCVETGGYADLDTNAMWSGFLIGRKLAAHTEKDAARYRWAIDNCLLGIGRNGATWDLQFEGPSPDHIGQVSDAIDEAMQCK